MLCATAFAVAGLPVPSWAQSTALDSVEELPALSAYAPPQFRAVAAAVPLQRHDPVLCDGSAETCAAVRARRAPSRSSPADGTPYVPRVNADIWTLKTADELRPREDVPQWRSRQRAETSNGFDPEPPIKNYAEQEILDLLADVLREDGIRRNHQRLPDISGIRAVREAEELERSHERGTVLEVEEYEGDSNEHTNPLAMATGIALFMAGWAVEPWMDQVDDHGDAFVKLRPKVWPVGIKLKGRFFMP